MLIKMPEKQFIYSFARFLKLKSVLKEKGTVGCLKGEAPQTLVGP